MCAPTKQKNTDTTRDDEAVSASVLAVQALPDELRNIMNQIMQLCLENVRLLSPQEITTQFTEDQNEIEEANSLTEQWSAAVNRAREQVALEAVLRSASGGL